MAVEGLSRVGRPDVLQMFTHVLRRYRKYTGGRPKRRFMDVVKGVKIVRVRRMQRKGLDEDSGEPCGNSQKKKLFCKRVGGSVRLQFQFRYVSTFFQFILA